MMLSVTATNVITMLSSTGVLSPPSSKSQKPKRPGWLKSVTSPCPPLTPRTQTPSRIPSPTPKNASLNSHSFHIRASSRSPSPINLKSLDLDVDSVREQMEFLSGGRVDALSGETPPLEMYGAGMDEDVSFDDAPTMHDDEKFEGRRRSDSKMRRSYSEDDLLERPNSRGFEDAFLMHAARVSTEKHYSTASSCGSMEVSGRRSSTPRMSAEMSGLPFRCMPASVMVQIVNHLMNLADLAGPSSRLLFALPLLYVNRSWSRGTARGLYKCPTLSSLKRFQSLLSTALEATPTHPYAAFVEELHLPQSLAEALYLGDLDIAFQLFPNLSSFRVSASPSTSNVLLQSLSDHCHGLKRLSLRGCPISDAMVPSLSAGCPKLELLDLSHTRVTIATLVTAVDLCTSLTSLLLEAALPSFIPVTWNPQHLFTRPLRYLNLRKSGATDPHLRHAALHCPDLSHVVLEGSAALTDDSLLKLSQSCASLRILDASFCPHLTDLSLHFLAMFTSSSLASVSLSGCDRITPDGVEALAEKCKGLEEVVLHGCASILNSHIRGFATKRYELDCSIQGDAVRLMAAGRARRIVARPLVDAAKVTKAEKREFATQTFAVEEKVDERRSVSRTESKDAVTDTSDATKASSVSSTSSMSSSRMSMPAEELLLKFAEAVADGTWFPRGADDARNPATQNAHWAVQQPMFWNPAWGYPLVYPPGSMPGGPINGPRRFSTTCAHSNASTSHPHSNRSSFIPETSFKTSTSVPMPPGSKLRRLSLQETSPPTSPPKSLGQRSQLPSSKLSATSSRIPSTTRLRSLSSSLQQPASPSVATSVVARQFSIAMMKGSKTVGGVTDPVNKEETYKPKLFKKSNGDYESGMVLPLPPKSVTTPQKTMLRTPSMSWSNSTTAFTPRASPRAAIDSTALAAFTSTLPDGRQDGVVKIDFGNYAFDGRDEDECCESTNTEWSQCGMDFREGWSRGWGSGEYGERGECGE